jgi:hypothetical protein
VRLFALIALILLGHLATAQIAPQPQFLSNGIYNFVTPTLANGQIFPFQLDVNGRLLVASTASVIGSVTATITNFPAVQPVSQFGVWSVGRTWSLGLATDSLIAGGTYNTTPPTLINGENFGLQLDSSGNLKVNATATIPGTVTVVQPTGANLHADIDNFPATTAVTQSTSPWVVSGTITANQGAPPWSVSQSGAWTTGRTWTLSHSTDSTASWTFDGSGNSIGSTTLSAVNYLDVWSPNMTQNGVAPPTRAGMIAGDDTLGAVSRYVVVNTQGQLEIDGGTASGASDLGYPVKVGGVYNSTQPTFSTGQRGDAQIDANGNLRVVLSSGNNAIGYQAGRGVLSTFTQSYSSSNLATGAFTTIITSTASTINEMDIFDTSGLDYYLAYAATCGALSTATNAIIVSPGGGGKDFQIPSGNCVGFEAKTALISAGSVNMTFYK